jgi:tRNA threonylcarbamoyladenosine biosynthesis protein TsaB
VILLGFDTATSATAVALRLHDGAAIEARDDPGEGQRPHHTSDLLRLAVRLMEGAEVGWGSLGGIAVGLGPGTFTGLRVGVATARGLAQSLGLPLIGVSSLRALALPALEDGAQAPLLAALDAKRGELFLAAYAAGTAEELLEPQAVKPEQIATILTRLGGLTPLAFGDGAVRFRAELQVAGVLVAPEDSPLHLLRAAAVCELAEQQGAGESVEEVLPRYGRRPDAEIAIEAGPR